MRRSLTMPTRRDDDVAERLAWEQYLREVNSIPSLSSDEEAGLAGRIRNGDEKAFNRLVEANLRFVVVIALEYQGKGIPLLDLVNEGNIGLIMAARRFDESRGCKFISYAVWWIRQSIRQAFAEQVRFIRLPRLQVEALQKLEETIRKREQAMGTSVNVQQMAMTDMPMPATRRRRLIGLMTTAAPPFSLDHSPEDEDSGHAPQLVDTLGPSPDEGMMDEMLKEAVHDAIQDLPEREANVLCQYYGVCDDDPKSLDEIGRGLGLSRERVRQIKERGLQRLRHTSRSSYLRAFL